MSIEEQDRLVAELRQGSHDAFGELYASLHGRIYNLAARVVGNTEDAADITQEVFIKAFTRIPTMQGELRLEPWLYRVAVNTCYDHLRRSSVRSTQQLDQIDEVADTIDGYDRSEMSSAVSRALQNINPRYRTALVLKDLHGFRNAEVAEVLGVTQGTANVMLFRARNAFKRAFREIAPAGSGRLSALGLMAFLPNLPVPHALHAVPDLSAGALGGGALTPAAAAAAAPAAAAPAAASAAPLAAGAVPAAQSGVGIAASAGVMAKIGGAVGIKIAAGLLGASVIAGGAVAVRETQTRHAPASPTPANTRVIGGDANGKAASANGNGLALALGRAGDVPRDRNPKARKNAQKHAAKSAAAKDKAKNGKALGKTKEQGSKKDKATGKDKVAGSNGPSAGQSDAGGNGNKTSAGSGSPKGSSGSPSSGGASSGKGTSSGDKATGNGNGGSNAGGNGNGKSDSGSDPE